MEVKNKADKNVRVVNRKTGKVSHIHTSYAYDKVWQKRTGNVPEPLPKAEDFKPVTQEVKTETKETKKEINAKPETVTNDGNTRNATSNTAGNTRAAS